MTRPEFLDKFIDEYTVDGIGKVIPDQSNLIYAIYTVLLESNLSRTDILQVDCDDQSIVVKLSSKDLAKSVKSKFNQETIRFGYDLYKMNVKLDKSYIYVDLELIEDNESEE